MTICFFASIRALKTKKNSSCVRFFPLKKLNVVKKQNIERAVITLEGIERFCLVCTNDVGVVILGMNVADNLGGILLEDAIPDRVDKVRFSKTCATIDEHRVVCAPPGLVAIPALSAARARSLAFPTIRFSKVKPGMSRVFSYAGSG